jgi:hypothetical protein
MSSQSEQLENLMKFFKLDIAGASESANRSIVKRTYLIKDELQSWAGTESEAAEAM